MRPKVNDDRKHLVIKYFPKQLLLMRLLLALTKMWKLLVKIQQASTIWQITVIQRLRHSILQAPKDLDNHVDSCLFSH